MVCNTSRSRIRNFCKLYFRSLSRVDSSLKKILWPCLIKGSKTLRDFYINIFSERLSRVYFRWGTFPLVYFLLQNYFFARQSLFDRLPLKYLPFCLWSARESAVLRSRDVTWPPSSLFGLPIMADSPSIRLQRRGFSMIPPFRLPLFPHFPPSPTPFRCVQTTESQNFVIYEGEPQFCFDLQYLDFHKKI